MKDCARCGCPEKKHCKGNIRHSTYKEQARMVPKPNSTNCLSRHCETVLCDCTNYVSPEPAPQPGLESIFGAGKRGQSS